MAIEQIRPKSLEASVQLLEDALERARSGESMGVFIVEYIPGGETQSSSVWENAVSKLPIIGALQLEAHRLLDRLA